MAPLDKKTILLVDNDILVLRTMRLLLTQRGYVVLSAEDGASAWEKVEEYNGHIDLVVTDVDMPKMSGTQLARHLLKSYPDLKIVFVSGRSLREIEHNEPLPSMSRFLEKPFMMDALEGIIVEALRVS